MKAEDMDLEFQSDYFYQKLPKTQYTFICSQSTIETVENV